MFKVLNRRKAKRATQSPNAAVKQVLNKLKNMGIAPKHIVDIGGNHGGWSRTALSVFPDAQLSIFEPQHRLAEHLADLARNSNVAIH